jgi:hypothetical protein
MFLDVFITVTKLNELNRQIKLIIDREADDEMNYLDFTIERNWNLKYIENLPQLIHATLMNKNMLAVLIYPLYKMGEFEELQIIQEIIENNKY